MIPRLFVLFFLIGYLIEENQASMDFTFDTGRKSLKIRYCFIPKSPIRITYETGSKSRAGSINYERGSYDPYVKGSFGYEAGGVSDFGMSYDYSFGGRGSYDARLGSWNSVVGSNGWQPGVVASRPVGETYVQWTS